MAAVTASTGCGPKTVDTSTPAVIYGADNRRDVYDAANPASQVTAAQSTVALIRPSSLTQVAGGDYELPGLTLGAAKGLCPGERFAQQPAAAFCSGFLVAPDIVATAGHCVRNAAGCDNVAFVFDFAYGTANADPTKVAAANVYRCAEVLATQMEATDFALVRLDRAVTGRAPLTVRKDGKIGDGAPLVLIGHPSGIPTKIAAGANVRSNGDAGFFVANTDSYGGNSGSAVLHATSGAVEGILVRGETDYVVKEGEGCMISLRCSDAACRGEDVTRTTRFAPFLSGTTRLHDFASLDTAIPDNDAAGVEEALSVSRTGTVAALSVGVSITHSYVGDLNIELVHPDGTSVVLKAADQQAGSNLAEHFGDGGTAVSGFDALKGKPANGTWHLRVSDRSPQDTGTLTGVTLTLTTR
jgi:subtilisin-like proprotein convertase family protein